MGDSPAANFMEITKRKTTVRGEHIDRRFKGFEDPATLACDGTWQQILDTGGWDLKAIAMSRKPDREALEKLGGAVLGLGWGTAEDI